MRHAVIALVLLLSGCAHRGRLACRLVALDPHGAVIKHGDRKPAKWHTGEDQCMVKLRVMESLPSEIQDQIGVEFRGSEAEVKALKDRWDQEHSKQEGSHGTRI
jgi:hypothetical protein